MSTTKLTLQYSALSASIVAVMATSTAHAEDLPHTTMQTITVTATADTNTQTGQSEEIYADDSVAMQQATHLKDYLNDVPGVEVSGTSNIDQGIYIRGVSDNDLKVTVDGVRQENQFFHHATNLALDSDLFKAAEVSVGNNSVTLGNNARGGAVAFKTVDAADLLKYDQDIGARVKVGYNSNDEQLQTVGTVYGKPTDNSDVLLSYGVRSADQGTDGDGNPLMTKESEITNILAKVSVSPAEGHKITANFSRYEDEGVYYNGVEKYNSDYTEYTDEDFVDRANINEQYSLGYEYNPSDNFGLEAKVYHTEREFLIRGSEGGVDGITAKAFNKLAHGSGDSTINHKLVYGAETYRKHSTNDFEDRSGNIINEKQTAESYGVYLEDQIDMGKLHLTPGVRFDYYKPASNVTDEDYNQVSGAFAASYDLTDNVSAFASYTQFFNGPPLPETIFNVDDGSVYYVPDGLEAETGANAEVGVSASFDEIFAENDYFSITAKAFQTNYDNEIYDATVDCDTGEENRRGACVGYFNAEDTKLEGYEIASSYGDDDSEITASFSHAENDRDEAYTVRNSGDTFALGYNHWFDNGSSLGGRFNYVNDVTKDGELYEGYQTFDIFGSYVPTALPDLKLDLGVYNVGDKHYASSNSTYFARDNYQMGRNVKVSATYQF